jgi:hypothetical protein
MCAFVRICSVVDIDCLAWDLKSTSIKRRRRFCQSVDLLTRGQPRPGFAFEQVSVRLENSKPGNSPYRSLNAHGW